MGQKHKSAICDRTPPTYTSNLVYMCAAGFRGPKSSNRIELSRLVQVIEIWCFGLPVALGKGQVGGGVSGGMGVSPHTCTCMHTHTHTCIELQMATSMEASMLSMFNMHVRACVHMHVHVLMHGTPPTHPYLPPPPRGVEPRNRLKFDNTSTYQDISIPFEVLKSVKNSPPMGGCVVWWVVGWVDRWGQVKSLKI